MEEKGVLCHISYELLCYSYFRAPMAHDCIDVCEETLEMLFRQRGIPDMHLDVPSNFAISGVFALGAIADGGSGCRGEHRRDKPGIKTHHSMLPIMTDLSIYANSGSIILDDMKDSQMVAYR